MQILSEGTSTGNAFKPNLYRNTVIIAGMASAVCIFIELVVCLILCAFKKKEDHSDDEYEYEARFGRYVYPRQELIDSEQHRLPHDNTRKAGTDDILAAFDDDDDDNIDFLTKNVVDKHDETFKKEAAVARESEPEPILNQEIKIESEAVSKQEAPIKVEYESEVKEEAEPEPEAEPEVQVEAEHEIEAEPEVQAEAEPDEAEDVIAKAFAVQSEEDVVEPEPFIEPEPVFNVKILGRMVK